MGRYLIQICRTTPCWLRGADDLSHACKTKLGVGLKEMTADGKFTVMEVECLGACANAPVVQIDNDYYTDLDAAKMEALLAALARVAESIWVGMPDGVSERLAYRKSDRSEQLVVDHTSLS